MQPPAAQQQHRQQLFLHLAPLQPQPTILLPHLFLLAMPLLQPAHLPLPPSLQYCRQPQP